MREVSHTLLHILPSYEAAFEQWRDILPLVYWCGMHAVNSVRILESWSRKEDVTRCAFKKLEELHLPSLLQQVCAHMNLKHATIHSIQAHIDTLITEQTVTFQLDHPGNKNFLNQTAARRYFCSCSARGLAHSIVIFFHICTPADAKI